MGRPTKLTAEVQKIIVEAIREGAYDWVAAQAAGIDRATFKRWMADPRPEFCAFRNRVQQARAEARKAAEIAVRKDNPFNWLRFGPGRERPGEPGWTESSKVEHSGDSENPLKIEIHRTDDWRAEENAGN